MTDYSATHEILQDLDSKGKPRPWKEKKRSNMDLEKSYGRLKSGPVVDELTEWKLAYQKYEVLVRECGSFLAFNSNGKLVSMVSCKKRLCPLCNWRKSMKVFGSVSKVMNRILEENPDLQPVFLTLTQRNCAFDDLRDEISRIMKGFYRLYKNDLFANQVVGWFRALEVTYSRKSDTWHPHIHAILLFDKSYFSKENDRYIDQPGWIRLWRNSMRLGYDPNVDIRKLSSEDGNLRKSVAEAAKYPLKDRQILTADLSLTDRLVDCLTRSLRRKRLFAFGGLMHKVAKELNVDKPDEGDLINIDEDGEMRSDVAEVAKVYRWHYGILDYVRCGSSNAKK